MRDGVLEIKGLGKWDMNLICLSYQGRNEF